MDELVGEALFVEAVGKIDLTIEELGLDLLHPHRRRLHVAVSSQHGDRATMRSAEKYGRPRKRRREGGRISNHGEA